MATLTCDRLRRFSGITNPSDPPSTRPQGKNSRCVNHFVMIIFEKTPFEGKRPLHVLVVVVGNDQHTPLHNAKAFCQSICDFWTKHDDASLAHSMSLSTVQLLASDPAPNDK